MVIALAALFVALSGASYAAIKTNAVGAKQIKTNAVRAAEIKDGVVGTAEAADGSLTGADVSDGSIGSADVNGLGSGDIADGSLNSGDIADESLTGGDIANGSIANPDLGDDSVGSSKIVDGSIAPADLSPPANGPTAFARVQADGTLEPGTGNAGAPPTQFKGVDATDIQKAGVGVYCFGGLGMTLSSALVSMDNAGAATTTTQVASVSIQRGASLGTCDADHQQARVNIINVDPALAAAAAQDGRFTIWFMGS
jgi:hypothetical protein